MDQLFLLEQQEENMKKKDLKCLSLLKSCLCAVFFLEDSASFKDTLIYEVQSLEHFQSLFKIPSIFLPCLE